MSDSDPLSRAKGSKFGCLSISRLGNLGGGIDGRSYSFAVLENGAEVTQEARRMAESLASDFDQAFQFTPQISVDSVVVIAANTPVLELVTTHRELLVRHRWSHTWLHSTKNLEVEATFTAKAGFDLKEPFRINIDPRTGYISAELPPPKLLSMGMSDVRVLQDEDGFWNKLTAEDRQTAFRALEDKARKKISNSKLLPEARLEAESKFAS